MTTVWPENALEDPNDAEEFKRCEWDSVLLKNAYLYTVEPRQFAVPLSRVQSFAGLKNIQKLKISKNIKFKLESTFKDELQKTGFKA